MGDYKAMLALDELAREVHDTATEKGWHSEPRSIGEEIALMHSELSEALEEVRDSKPLLYFRLPDGTETGDPYSVGPFENVPNKAEGVAAEFADVIIRILDTAQERGIPVVDALLHKKAYNRTRPFRHGGKAL